MKPDEHKALIPIQDEVLAQVLGTLVRSLDLLSTLWWSPRREYSRLNVFDVFEPH
jgi:hypothetical protein